MSEKVEQIIDLIETIDVDKTISDDKRREELEEVQAYVEATLKTLSGELP